MKGYSEKEIGNLLTLVLDAARSGKSLTCVFKEFAEKTGRAKGSVRNFYYKFIKEVGGDEKLMKKYPLAKDMAVGKNVAFTKEEEEDVYRRINEQVKTGKSVRKSVYYLAGGDEKLALRYQNKYRNMKKIRSSDFENDGTYKLLSEKINILVERIGKSLRSENERLKKTVDLLREENKRLRSGSDADVIVDYFSENKTGNVEKNA